jgi:hypothetical protein
MKTAAILLVSVYLFMNIGYGVNLKRHSHENVLNQAGHAECSRCKGKGYIYVEKVSYKEPSGFRAGVSTSVSSGSVKTTGGGNPLSTGSSRIKVIEWVQETCKQCNGRGYIE